MPTFVGSFAFVFGTFENLAFWVVKNEKKRKRKRAKQKEKTKERTKRRRRRKICCRKSKKEKEIFSKKKKQQQKHKKKQKEKKDKKKNNNASFLRFHFVPRKTQKQKTKRGGREQFGKHTFLNFLNFWNCYIFLIFRSLGHKVVSS